MFIFVVELFNNLKLKIMYLNYNFTENTNVLIFAKNNVYKNGIYCFDTLEKIILTENKKETIKKYVSAGFTLNTFYKYCNEYKGLNIQVFKEKSKFVSILHVNYILSIGIELNKLKID